MSDIVERNRERARRDFANFARVVEDNSGRTIKFFIGHMKKTAGWGAKLVRENLDGLEGLGWIIMHNQKVSWVRPLVEEEPDKQETALKGTDEPP